MANLFTLGFGKVSDLIGKLAEAGLTAEMAEEVRKDPALAEIVVNALKHRSAVVPAQALFTEPYGQIEAIRHWNQQLGWRISDEEFAKASSSVPTWPKDELVAVTLVPYLDEDPPAGRAGKKGRTGMERTFQELWEVATGEPYDGLDRPRLLKGVKHTPGLRWEVMDLGCHRNVKPKDIRDPATSPHAGILASAALHPNWIKNMDGKNVPYVFAPGYKVDVPGQPSWGHVPFVGYVHGDRSPIRWIHLSCCANDISDPSWAVPAFVSSREGARENP